MLQAVKSRVKDAIELVEDFLGIEPETWKTIDGIILVIREMETSHLINAMKMMERSTIYYHRPKPIESHRKYQKYSAMRCELEKRSGVSYVPDPNPGPKPHHKNTD